MIMIMIVDDAFLSDSVSVVCLCVRCPCSPLSFLSVASLVNAALSLVSLCHYGYARARSRCMRVHAQIRLSVCVITSCHLKYILIRLPVIFTMRL